MSLGTIDVKVQDIKLYDNASAATGLTDGILDAHRLGTTGARIAAGATVVAGTDAAGDTYTVSTMSVKGFSDAQITKQINVIEAALKEMTTAATNLGAAKSRIDLQKTFTTQPDGLHRARRRSARRRRHEQGIDPASRPSQVQQQLGIQALSIANGNSQSILSLFR